VTSRSWSTGPDHGTFYCSTSDPSGAVRVPPAVSARPSAASALLSTRARDMRRRPRSRAVLSRTSRKIRRPSSTHLELSASPRWAGLAAGPMPSPAQPSSQRGCVAAATIASVAPFGVTGLDWFAGMGQENIDEFGAALKGEAAISDVPRKGGGRPSRVHWRGGRGRAWRPGHGGRPECPHGRVRRGPG